MYNYSGIEVANIEYQDYTSCNRCSATNEITSVETLNGSCISSCETVCTVCGFEDSWSCGWYASSGYIDSRCNTYTVGNNKIKR